MCWPLSRWKLKVYSQRGRDPIENLVGSIVWLLYVRSETQMKLLGRHRRSTQCNCSKYNVIYRKVWRIFVATAQDTRKGSLYKSFPLHCTGRKQKSKSHISKPVQIKVKLSDWLESSKKKNNVILKIWVSEKQLTLFSNSIWHNFAINY